MFCSSPSVIPPHTPGTDGPSRATHLCVSLVAHSASYFSGAAGCSNQSAGCGFVSQIPSSVSFYAVEVYGFFEAAEGGKRFLNAATLFVISEADS